MRWSDRPCWSRSLAATAEAAVEPVCSTLFGGAGGTASSGRPNASRNRRRFFSD